MKLKIVTAMLLSAVLSGCAVYPEPKVNKSSKTIKRTTTTTKKKLTAKTKPTSKKTATAPKKTNPVKKVTPKASAPVQKKPVVSTPKISPPVAKVVTNTTKIQTTDSSLPALKKTTSLNKANFEIDKQHLLKCEKQGLCFKEIVIVDNKMSLKVEIPEDIYEGLKNKDNLVTYYNNDVRIFKSNPDLYLKKYGLIHKKYTNPKEMLLNLPEVQVKDIFGSKVFVRFKPY